MITLSLAKIVTFVKTFAMLICGAAALFFHDVDDIERSYREKRTDDVAHRTVVRASSHIHLCKSTPSLLGSNNSSIYVEKVTRSQRMYIINSKIGSDNCIIEESNGIDGVVSIRSRYAFPALDSISRSSLETSRVENMNNGRAAIEQRSVCVTIEDRFNETSSTVVRQLSHLSLRTRSVIAYKGTIGYERRRTPS